MLAKSSLALINRRGIDMNIISKSGGDYDTTTRQKTGETETNIPVKGLCLEYTAQDRSDGLIEEGDRKVVIAALGVATPPKVNDRVSFLDPLTNATSELLIMGIRVINDKGAAVIWVCRSRAS